MRNNLKNELDIYSYIIILSANLFTVKKKDPHLNERSLYRYKTILEKNKQSQKLLKKKKKNKNSK